jgi:hypothetical protein
MDHEPALTRSAGVRVGLSALRLLDTKPTPTGVIIARYALAQD